MPAKHQPWVVVALLSGVAGASVVLLVLLLPSHPLPSLGLPPYWPHLCLGVGLLITLFVLMRNPAGRYLRAYSMLIGFLIAANTLPEFHLQVSSEHWGARLIQEGTPWHLNIVLGGLAAVLMVLDYLTHRSLALRREKAPEAPSHASPSLHALGWYDRGFRPALLERLQTEFIPRRATALHKEVAISLRMEAQAAQVKPSFIVAPIGAKPNTPWPKDTTIMDVFAAKEVQYKLLILGEPGAGKTTTLLELALHLLTEAKQDPDQPVPIIFECSTWHGQSIIAWLAQQMQERYKILPDMGCRLVEAQAILPLLDGFDELLASRQADFILRVNTFQRQQTRLVICSRRQAYELQEQKLELNSAVYLEPLETDVIGDYLDRLHCPQIRQLLNQHPVLHDLARTPLFLSMMVLCRDKLRTEDLAMPASPEAYRAYLFNTYLAQRFETELPISGEESSVVKPLTWLSWLAQLLRQRSESEFYVESLQPSLLKNIWPFGLAAGLVAGLVAGLPERIMPYHLRWLCRLLIGCDRSIPKTYAACCSG